MKVYIIKRNYVINYSNLLNINTQKMRKEVVFIFLNTKRFMNKKIQKALSCTLVLGSVCGTSTMPVLAYGEVQSRSWAEDNIETLRTSAKQELENYVSLSNYRSAQQSEIRSMISNASKRIDIATSKSEINSIVSSTKSSIDKVKTSSQMTDEENQKAQEAERKELANAKSAGISSVKNTVIRSNYRSAEQSRIDSIISTATSQINSAGSVSSVNSIVSRAKSELLALKTNSQYVKEENQAANAALQQKKANAKKELANYLNKSNYRAEGQAQIDSLLVQAGERIDNATSESVVNNLVSTYKQKLNRVKTSAQLSTSESQQNANNASKNLSARKASGKAELSKLVNLNDYSDSVVAQMERIISNARTKIDNAKSVDEIDSIISGAKTELNSIAKNKGFYTTKNKSASAFESTSKQGKAKNTSNKKSNQTNKNETTKDGETTEETSGDAASGLGAMSEDETTTEETTTETESETETVADGSASSVSTFDTTPVENTSTASITILGIATALLSGVLLTRKKK